MLPAEEFVKKYSEVEFKKAKVCGAHLT